MKSNYDKYMQQVWDMKDKAYEDFKKSNFASYIDYIKNELKGIKLNYKKQERVNTVS